MNRLLGGLLACVLAGAAFPAAADYPDRPITLINPNSPGGSTDIGIRMYQPYLEACLGTGASLVPVAMPGAAALIGLTALSQAPGDGYTIGSANMPNLVLGVVLNKASYKYEDFEYLGAVIGANTGIAVRTDSPLKTFEDFKALVDGSAETLKIGVAGRGADDHLAGIAIAKALGKPMDFIPFGSGADTRTALLGGHTDIALISSTTVGQFKDQIRFLALAAEKRSDFFPDVSTLREKGVDVVGGSTHLLIAPKGSPAEATAKWRDCIQVLVKDPVFLKAAAERSISLNPMDGPQARAYADSQYEMLKALWAESPWE